MFAADLSVLILTANDTHKLPATYSSPKYFTLLRALLDTLVRFRPVPEYIPALD